MDNNNLVLILLFANIVIVSVGLSVLFYQVEQTYKNSNDIKLQTAEINNLAIRIHNDTSIFLDKILVGVHNNSK